jgi:hypothetical protein
VALIDFQPCISREHPLSGRMLMCSRGRAQVSSQLSSAEQAAYGRFGRMMSHVR